MNQKSQRQPENIFTATIKKLGEHACAVCARQADAVARFIPDRPEDFGMDSTQALYVPVCRTCLEAGIDFEFLELVLKKCGTKLKVE